MFMLSEGDVRVVASRRYWRSHWKILLIWLLGSLVSGALLNHLNWYWGFVPCVSLVAWVIWWLRGISKAEGSLVAEWKKG